MAMGLDMVESQLEVEEDQGEPRILTTFIFPFFPQYQDIDLGANLNNLKSPNTMAFFIIRDAVGVSFWGRINRLEV